MKISVKLDTLDDAIKAIRELRQSLRGKADKIARRLAEMGLGVASVKFAAAAYDGENDASLSIKEIDHGHYAVQALGKSVLFIEFGTGIHNPEHPLANEFAMKHGEYGQGKGKNRSWGYYGKPGTNGKYLKTTEKGDVYITKGNPPAMAMYQAGREMEDAILSVVREVLGND